MATRILTDTDTIAWDEATADQIKSNVVDGSVTNAKLADMAQGTIKGRQTGGGTGDPEDLTHEQVKAILGFPTTTVDNVLARYDGTTGNMQSSGIVVDDSDNILLAATTANLDTDAISGYFADYECLGALHFQLIQAEDQSDHDGGGFRDLAFFEHQDNDQTDYEALSDQKVSMAVRGLTTGKQTAGVYQTQYKDLVGADFAAIGRIEWADRGVSGILAAAIQYGGGIASNEFLAQQPSDAATQSPSMAAVQAIISSKMAAADGSHLARGVLATNIGKLATAAFEALSGGTGGDNGQFDYLLKGNFATVATGAILMPASASGNAGTIIEYDANDWTQYDRTANAYSWVIGGVAELNLSASALYPGVNDGLALGITGNNQWADLFLALEGSIQWNNGDVAISHSANALAFTGGSSGYSFDAIVSGTDANFSGGLRIGFAGAPSADTVSIADANFFLDFNAGVPLLAFDSNDYIVFNRASDLYQVVIGGDAKVQIDNTSTAGQTALLLYDVDNNTVERVTVGAADSGGSGFKVLRIPN